jgi:hypothetical protein
VDVKNKNKCEGCRLKQANFGLPGEGAARWCGGCAKAHAGAVDVKHKKCEGCKLKLPSFGLPGKGKKQRWCGDCVPKGAHDGGGHTQVESSPRASAPNLRWGSGYRLVIGDPYEAAPEPGSGCGGRWQTEKKAAPKKLEAAKKKAAPKKK